MQKNVEPSRDLAARDLAARLAGASHSRRLYAMKGPVWERTLLGLKEDVEKHLARSGGTELTFALLGEGIAVDGVPILDPSSAVLRLIGALKACDVEIVAFKPGVELSELEALLAYLGADSADVAAMRADVYLRERGVEHIDIKHLALMKDAEQASFREVYVRGKKTLSREMRRAEELGTVSNGAVGELARSLVELISGTRAPIATLLALRDRDDFAVVHSVNVGMLAGMQAAALGIEGDEAEAIVFAGLMHDVGKTKVPEAILSKRTGLTDKESALLARHTVEGARIIFQTGGVDQLAAIAAFEHHASGPSKDALLAVELVKLADTFDNIRTLRPFDDQRSMRGAVAYMTRRIGSRFNPYALERFASLIGLFQDGEHARLSSGEFVRIIDPNAELGLRPTVEVLDRSHGELDHGEIVDFAVLDEGVGTPRVIPTLPALFADLEPAELDALG